MYTLKKRVLKISKRKMGTTGIKEMNRQSRKEKKLNQLSEDFLRGVSEISN